MTIVLFGFKATTYLESNRIQSIVRHKYIVAIEDQSFHVPNNRVNNAWHRCPALSNRLPSILCHTYKRQPYNVHDLNILDPNNRLYHEQKKQIRILAINLTFDFFKEANIYKRNITMFTMFTLISREAMTISVHTIAVSITIGNLTFVIAKITFLSLPTGMANTFTVQILSTTTAQNGTCHCKK